MFVNARMICCRRAIIALNCHAFRQSESQYSQRLPRKKQPLRNAEGASSDHRGGKERMSRAIRHECLQGPVRTKPRTTGGCATWTVNDGNVAGDAGVGGNVSHVRAQEPRTQTERRRTPHAISERNWTPRVEIFVSITLRSGVCVTLFACICRSHSVVDRSLRCGVLRSGGR